MLPRLREALDALNRQPGRRFSLSLSLGVAQYESDSFNSVDQLLATADQALYRQKRRNHAEPFAHSRQHAVVARSPALRREERR
jgi:GGDEF domain-containing protein